MAELVRRHPERAGSEHELEGLVQRHGAVRDEHTTASARMSRLSQRTSTAARSGMTIRGITEYLKKSA